MTRPIGANVPTPPRAIACAIATVQRGTDWCSNLTPRLCFARAGGTGLVEVVVVLIGRDLIVFWKNIDWAFKRIAFV